MTGISAVKVISGDMTFGVMMTLGYITGRLALPFSTITSMVNSLQDATLAYNRVDEVIGNKDECKGKKKYKSGDIILKNVFFKYPGSSSPIVIKNFTLDIKLGEMTALVGESGCGKSTLIKLILGFHLPKDGEILLGNQPLAEINHSEWLKHCGAVMQEGKIFTASILENIALSDKEPNIDKAFTILDKVGLKDFVENLPMGIHTKLGVSGIEVSGGQKQRLMIARALYKDPEILFLDEATSSLDANTEKFIMDNLRQFRKGRTMIVAAHRLSTVMDADRIIYIKEGKLIEQGTHQELINLKGEYWKLVKNQLTISID